MEGVFTCSEIKVSFAGVGLWRHGCEQNVNGEKSLCFGTVFLASRFERFALSLALRIHYIQIILDLCKVVNRKTVGGDRTHVHRLDKTEGNSRARIWPIRQSPKDSRCHIIALIKTDCPLENPPFSTASFFWVITMRILLYLTAKFGGWFLFDFSRRRISQFQGGLEDVAASLETEGAPPVFENTIVHDDNTPCCSLLHRFREIHHGCHFPTIVVFV